jgi:hypothetical protein
VFVIKFPDRVPQHVDISLHDLLLSASLMWVLVPMFFRKKKSRRHPDNEIVDRQKGIIWPLAGFAFLLMLSFRIFI